MLRVQVPRGTATHPPVHVTVTGAGSFEFEQDPWPSGTLPYNRVPCVEAGDDFSAQLSELVILDGRASDDGLPDPPGALSLAWNKLMGPDPVGFGSPTSSSTARRPKRTRR